MFSSTDTIVAVATAPGRSGIGVVRMSGPRAHEIGLVLLGRKRPLEPRHVTLGRVVDAAGDARDEVLATFFPRPHSYTTEDLVEISGHGSMALLDAIVRAAVAAGARVAEPGEFTLRAFVNGRIDLVQAEAVADLVDAVTPLQARAAFDQLEGTLTRAIAALDRELLDLAARLEASLDFPEEGYHFVDPGDTARALESVRSGIDRLLATAGRGRVIREGRRVAIVGKPNVGKSSLFNWLVGTDRAIVAEHPGTTRDLVSETIEFEGVKLGLVDTAGQRAGQDPIEREGISRARGAAAVADLVIVVCDASRPLDQEDRRVLAATGSATRVVVINKADLAGSVEQHLAEAGASAVVVSLKTGAGLETLREVLRERLCGGAEPSRDTPMITNARHEALLSSAREALGRALAGLRERGAEEREELVLADIAAARAAFESVTGRRTADDLLREIFSRFCIGK